MTLVHNLQATFPVSIGRPITIPANTKTMVFFGTAGDGNETNRVPAGSPLTVTSGTPTHAANYVSVGHQPVASPTRFDVIDTGVPLDATNFAAGFTWACVARSQLESNNYNQAMGNMTATSGQGQNMSGLCLWAGNRVVLYQAGQRAILQLANSVTTTWHFIAMTGSGGSAPTWFSYDFTENQAGQSATYSGLTGLISIPAMTTHFGMLSTENAVVNGPVDIAFGYVASGPMSQANLAALAASVRPYLARRGIVM